MGLVLGSHPSSQTLVQQNVLGVERLKLWVLSRSNLLADEVVGPQVQRNPDDPNRRHPQPRHGHEQHEEVQPALVRERDSENLGPEPIGRHH